MASQGQSFADGDRLTDRISIGVLARVVPREIIDEVLAETGEEGAENPPVAGSCGGVLRDGDGDIPRWL
jgi:Insertion element 4 transposase N-terminal